MVVSGSKPRTIAPGPRQQPEENGCLARQFRVFCRFFLLESRAGWPICAASPVGCCGRGKKSIVPRRSNHLAVRHGIAEVRANPFRRIGLQERSVGSPVSQRLADGIETPGGKVNEHIYWTDACVPIEPRHGFIEITQRQLHLFSRGVVRRNREQHVSLSSSGLNGSSLRLVRKTRSHQFRRRQCMQGNQSWERTALNRIAVCLGRQYAGTIRRRCAHNRVSRLAVEGQPSDQPSLMMRAKSVAPSLLSPDSGTHPTESITLEGGTEQSRLMVDGLSAYLSPGRHCLESSRLGSAAKDLRLLSELTKQGQANAQPQQHPCRYRTDP